MVLFVYLHTKLKPIQSILGEVMAIFPKAAILVLRKWWFWLSFLLQGVILHQRTEFDDNPPIHGLEIARLRNPKWRPPPSWILVRWHFWSGIPIYGDILYLHTKYKPNPWILVKVMAIFFLQNPRRSAVRHFGIVMPSFMTIRVEYLVMSWVCIKFHSNKLLSFEDI